MSLMLRENRTFIPIPEGSYMARRYALIDLGEQYNKFYDNTLPKVMIGWELTSQSLNEQEKPLVHFQRYTASLNAKSSLRALLEGWQGESFTSEALKGFDLKTFLGKPCYLTIQQRLHLETKQRWAKVIAICPLPDVMFCPPAIHKPIYFDLDNYTENNYLAVLEGIRKYINLSAPGENEVSTPQKPPTSTYSPPHHPPDPDEPQSDVDL